MGSRARERGDKGEGLGRVGRSVGVGEGMSALVLARREGLARFGSGGQGASGRAEEVVRDSRLTGEAQAWAREGAVVGSEGRGRAREFGIVGTPKQWPGALIRARTGHRTSREIPSNQKQKKLAIERENERGETEFSHK